MNNQEFWNRGHAAHAEPTTASAFGRLSRRGFLKSLAGTAAAALTGCTSKFGLRKCEIAPDAPMSDLVTHLNRNIDQIDSWRCPNVTLKTPWFPSVSGMIAVERPLNFRLEATAMGNSVADMGSNDDRFWFWMRNDEDPGILTAKHTCLAAAQRHMPLPFEPDWLIEALGVIPLDENEIDFERDPNNPKQCFFRRERTAPDGKSVLLTTTVDTCNGVIVGHSLADHKGRIIALAQMGEHEHNGKTGPVLPHKVTLQWPPAKLSLTMRMGAIEINPTSLASELFSMPNIAGCPVYDIGGETQQATHEGRAKV